MQTSNSTFIKATLRKLISDSNIHAGFRVLVAMAITFIPFVNRSLLPYFAQSSLNISITLCLGVMASAIVETDDNYKGRGKFIATIAICFFIAAGSVELLMPFPLLFAIGLLLSSFVFMMLAALGTHYNKVGFGAILIAIYTMIGYQADAVWYERPLLFSVGALWYGLFSISWNYFKPYRSLREQLAQLFFSLSRYQLQKSALFNEKEGSSKEGIFSVRQQLAMQNIAIVARLEQSQRIIQSRLQLSTHNKELSHLNNYLFIAEQIHERICASQYLYSQLESTFGESQILEGFHQLLLQLSEDCYQLGMAINDNKPYQHSRRLKWNINALSDQLYLLKHKLQLFDNSHEAMQALEAIYDNLHGIDQLLLNINKTTTSNIAELIAIDGGNSPSQSIFKQLQNAITSKSHVFKHAIRISTSLSLAYALQHLLHLPQGFWVLLTVLFVCQPSYSETRKRLIQRSIGTLLGIVLGYPIILLAGSVFSQVLLLIFSAFLFFNYLRTNYALAVIFMTLFVISLFSLLTGTGVEILPARIGETLLGCSLSILAITFIYPDWQFQRFPKLVQHLLNLSGDYFSQITTQYQSGRNENIHYRVTRFNTFKSDAALTSAWQSMLFEPRAKQKLGKEIYALVNRCDALVSYIAALASHRHKIDGFESNRDIQELFKATALLISARNTLSSSAGKELIESVEKFAGYKTALSGETLLIVEQLRLIAFTAVDIQLLLQQVNFDSRTKI